MNNHRLDETRLADVFPPDLAYEEEVHPCGYSPRVMRHLRWEERGPEMAHDLAFVGCKDGSIWVADQDPDGRSSCQQLLSADDAMDHGSKAAGVRAICPSWTDRHLFIGRSDGEIGVLRWNKASEMESPTCDAYHVLAKWTDFESRTNSNDGNSRSSPSVKTISRLNNRWAYISWTGQAGTYLIDLEKQGLDCKRYVPEAFVELTDHEHRPVTALRLACRLRCWRTTEERKQNQAELHSEAWLLISERGKVYTWDGPPEGSSDPAMAKPVTQDLWYAGERPSFINDYSRWGQRGTDDLKGPFNGVFLATDRGVFLVVLIGGENGPVALPPHRLSLPGLGVVCTALTYAEADLQLEARTGTQPESKTKHRSRRPSHKGSGIRFLWVVDSRGNCHLFCDASETETLGNGNKSGTPGLYPPGFPNFRTSGFAHLNSQALLAYSWKSLPKAGERTHRLTFAHARRNDRIAIGQYRQTYNLLDSARVFPAESEALRAKARHLLSHACTNCMFAFVEEQAHDSTFLGPGGKGDQVWDYEIIAEFCRVFSGTSGNERGLRGVLD